jgi:hypothetical protein
VGWHFTESEYNHQVEWRIISVKYNDDYLDEDNVSGYFYEYIPAATDKESKCDYEYTHPLRGTFE